METFDTCNLPYHPQTAVQRGTNWNKSHDLNPEQSNPIDDNLGQQNIVPQ